MNVMLAKRLNDQTQKSILPISLMQPNPKYADYETYNAPITKGGIGQIGDDPTKQKFNKPTQSLQENKNNLENILDKFIKEVILNKVNTILEER